MNSLLVVQDNIGLPHFLGGDADHSNPAELGRVPDETVIRPHLIKRRAESISRASAYDFTLHYLIHPAVRGEYLIPLVLFEYKKRVNVTRLIQADNGHAEIQTNLYLAVRASENERLATKRSSISVA